MPTVLLNKANNFRANVTAAAATTVFLIKGSTADALVYSPPGGALVGQVQGVTPGNIANIPGIVVGAAIQVQINPMDSKLGNATVTF